MHLIISLLVCVFSSIVQIKLPNTFLITTKQKRSRIGALNADLNAESNVDSITVTYYVPTM